jgi:DNA-binding LytR/AlgR family response regulator
MLAVAAGSEPRTIVGLHDSLARPGCRTVRSCHAGTESHLVRETLQQIEARLDPARFVRVHRSAIVQLDRIRELRARDRAVFLRDGTRIQSAAPAGRR